MITLSHVDGESLADLREIYRRAMKTQIVHDQIHTRSGWTRNVLIEINSKRAGFATIAEGGPWRDANALLEFWLRPEFGQDMVTVFQQLRAFDSFPAFDVQTIQRATTSLIYAFAQTIECEKIVFRDGMTTHHQQANLRLIAMTEPELIRHAMDVRSGGGEWELVLGDECIGKGGLLFHYNPPYGDVYMEIVEEHRNRGLGRFLIQELKRECIALGQIPAARCSPTNQASFKSLIAAGFEPYSQILIGKWKKLSRDGI